MQLNPDKKQSNFTHGLGFGHVQDLNSTFHSTSHTA